MSILDIMSLCLLTLLQPDLIIFYPNNDLITILILISEYFNLLFIYYFWLRWVFVAARRLSLVAASRGGATLCCSVRASHCGGFSCCGARL